MRNKNTIYIMIGIAFIIVLSIGYALFSETISIQGTARADGTFDVDIIECKSTFTSSEISEYDLTNEDNYGYTSASCTVSNDQSSATFNTVYNVPDGVKTNVIKIKNNGTINARLLIDGGVIVNQKICVDGADPQTLQFDSARFDGVIDEQNECGHFSINYFAEEIISSDANVYMGLLFSSDIGIIGFFDENGTDISDNPSRFVIPEGGGNQPTEVVFFPGDEMWLTYREHARGSDPSRQNSFYQTNTVTATFHFTQPTVS